MLSRWRISSSICSSASAGRPSAAATSQASEIGGLAQGRRQGGADPVEGHVQPVLLGQELGAGIADLDDPLGVEVAEHRQIAHEPAHGVELTIGHPPLRRRHQDHGVDQRRVVIEFLVHMSIRWK